jgi:blue copper oxidase
MAQDNGRHSVQRRLVSRRGFLATAAGVAGGAAFSGALGWRDLLGQPSIPAVAAQSSGGIGTPAEVGPFALTQGPDSLRVPPLLQPRERKGAKIFDLTLQRGQSEFLPGRPIATLGINGPYLGPTVRARIGESVVMNVMNEIDEPTTLHWHGMHLPAAMDGGPHQVIQPGATWSPRFAIRQEAATLWFHPHLLGRTEEHVARGIVGLFIIDDDNPAQALLPHTYGVDDLPIILQDVNANGALVRGFRGQGGGAQTLANGGVGSTFATDQPRLRLRLLNATSRRIYNLGLSDDMPFDQIASDGGLLPEPVAMTRLQLGPAERAEILVDTTGADPVVLRTVGGGSDSLLTIQPVGAAAAEPVPARLKAFARLAPESADITRDMILGRVGGGGRFSINGQFMTAEDHMHDMANTIRARVGDTELWNVVNQSGNTHLFHVHDVEFQIVDRSSGPLAANELGRKDTVLVRGRETVRIMMRFADYSDATTPYMFHCHVLNHEDQGMMGQFLVV